MKYKLIILIMSMCLPYAVNASDFSLTLSCPDTAKAGDIISCSINAKTNNLTGISAKYSLSSGLEYNSLNLDSGTTYNVNVCNSNGFSLGNTSGLPNTFKVGILKVKLSSNAGSNQDYKVSLVNLDGSDFEFNNVTGSNVSETIRIKSNNNNLNNLQIHTTEGYLDLGFSENKLNYTINSNDSVVIITGTTSDKNAKVTGLGSKSLNYGSNEFKIVVTSEIGTKKTYTINIIREDLRSSNNKLKSLSVSNTGIRFNNTEVYKETVNSNVESIKIDATAEDEKSKIEGLGEKKLNYGLNSFKVVVTAENGNKKTYSIDITRKDDRSADNSLKSLMVGDKKIELGTSNAYDVVVDSNVTNINLSASANNEKAIISGLGTKTLKHGINTFKIIVTAENKKERIYVLNVNRKDESIDNNISDNIDNTLKSLTVSNTNIVFNGSDSYTAVVENSISNVNIIAIANSEKAKVTGAGYHELEIGENKILVKVVASDQSEKIYTINIIRNQESSKKQVNIYLIIFVFISIFITLGVAIFLKMKKRKEFLSK